VDGVVKQIVRIRSRRQKAAPRHLNFDTEAAELRGLTAQIDNAEEEFSAAPAVDQGVVAKTGSIFAHAARQPAGQYRPAARRHRAKSIYAPGWPPRPARNFNRQLCGTRAKIVWLQKIDSVYADFSVTGADYGASGKPAGNGAVQFVAGSDIQGRDRNNRRMSGTARMITVRRSLPTRRQVAARHMPTWWTPSAGSRGKYRRRR
jgi:hypothetical protein